MSETNTENSAIEIAAKLDEREQYALTKWQNSNHPPLAPDTQAKLFRLYLNGKTTHQIHQMNPQFSLGQIVQAKVKGKWDERAELHLDELLNGVKARVQQVTLESIHFVADMISAANKMHGEAIKKYLQTEDPADLGDLKITTLDGYRKAVELLQKLTGQDKPNNKGELVVTHKADESMKNTANVMQSADEAAEILRLLVQASSIKKD